MMGTTCKLAEFLIPKRNHENRLFEICDRIMVFKNEMPDIAGRLDIGIVLLKVFPDRVVSVVRETS